MVVSVSKNIKTLRLFVLSMYVQKIQEIGSTEIEQLESIFIGYFADLYKDISPQVIGIDMSVDAYLAAIFNKTHKALLDKKLNLAFAYFDTQVVGCTTYELLQDVDSVLIRTLPINILYKHHELAIRNALVQHVLNQYPTTQRVLVMVRTANAVHRDLCMQGGFKLYNEIFEKSKYIKALYNEHYKAYVYE